MKIEFATLTACSKSNSLRNHCEEQQLLRTHCIKTAHIMHGVKLKGRLGLNPSGNLKQSWTQSVLD